MEEKHIETKDRLIGIYQTEMHREKWINKTEQNIQKLWDNFKICEILVIGVASGEKQIEQNFFLMAKHILKLMIPNQKSKKFREH